MATNRNDGLNLEYMTIKMALQSHPEVFLIPMVNHNLWLRLIKKIITESHVGAG